MFGTANGNRTRILALKGISPCIGSLLTNMKIYYATMQKAIDIAL
jgi:hypothetical protein